MTQNFINTQFPIYGGSYIAQFKLGETRSGVPTLEVEMAPTVGSGQNRKGLWEKKSAFQFKPETELVLLGQLFVGKVSSVKFDYHGPQNNKSFYAARNQDNTISINLREGKEKSFSVVAEASSQFHLLMMTCKPLAIRHMTDLNTVANFLRVVPVNLKK
ncbi:hypothetical protein [Vibrio agarivorans]|uniref:Uncharacterized protein n=1 Tax=Vibrio agarivorans TaxID=153622 RepID=A0ABT7Y6Z0_9VIBR|nr:hypothetical protein [Vibrio agarivorans]MDN2483820.1 hypothetical protein [Vibrio agarivorans]